MVSLSLCQKRQNVDVNVVASMSTIDKTVLSELHLFVYTLDFPEINGCYLFFERLRG